MSAFLKLLMASGNGELADITVVDDGDFAPSSGTGTATHTYNSRTSSGPKTILCISHTSGGGRTITGITWGGNAMSEIAQGVDPGSGPNCAIFGINGAQSGNIVISFNGSASDSEITILSLTNLSSLVPEDTDYSNGASSVSRTLTGLAAPSAGGISIAVWMHYQDPGSTSWTWTGHTEASDLDAGTYIHSVAYEVNHDGGDITATSSGAAAECMLVGASLR